MSVGVVDGSVDEGLSMNRDIGWWKISRRCIRTSLYYEEQLARYYQTCGASLQRARLPSALPTKCKVDLGLH